MGSNLMRTVTFADLQVVDYLKQNFVVVWHNQSAAIYEARGKQEKYTAEQVKAYPQGGGGGNVRSYFCAPNGKVLYYLEGFWSGDRYVMEARFAGELAVKLKTVPEAEHLALTRAAVAKREEQVSGQRQAIREQHPDEFKGRFQPTDTRRKEAALGLLERTLQLTLAQLGQPVDPILKQLLPDNVRRGVLK